MSFLDIPGVGIEDQQLPVEQELVLTRAAGQFLRHGPKAVVNPFERVGIMLPVVEIPDKMHAPFARGIDGEADLPVMVDRAGKGQRLPNILRGLWRCGRVRHGCQLSITDS